MERSTRVVRLIPESTSPTGVGRPGSRRDHQPFGSSPLGASAHEPCWQDGRRSAAPSLRPDEQDRLAALDRAEFTPTALRGGLSLRPASAREVIVNSRRAPARCITSWAFAGARAVDRGEAEPCATAGLLCEEGSNRPRQSFGVHAYAGR